MQSTRDPYPYPLFENDNTYQGGVFERVSNLLYCLVGVMLHVSVHMENGIGTCTVTYNHLVIVYVRSFVVLDIHTNELNF